MANPALQQYCFSLSYDPRIVLSVVADGATSAVPVRDKQSTNNAVIICTRTQTRLARNLGEVAVLNPTVGVIYPGALILANEDLMDGHPTPIALPRAPCMLSIDLPGLKNPGASVTPDTASVQSFINEKLEAWNQDAVANGYINAARSVLNIAQSFSSQQVALELGFNATWATGNASTQLSCSSTSERSVVVAYYKQVFYTVTMNTPLQASAVFADTVTEDDARQVFNNDSPPAYVRSVDYGRLLMVRMETTSIDTSANLKGAFEHATGGGLTVGGNLESRFKEIVRNSTFTVLALGGGAETPVQLFSGASEGELKGLKDYLARDARYRRDNPGLPIAFQVAFLKDNRYAMMGFTTDYTETQCIRYPNAFVRFRHAGAYVAKFQIDWVEADIHGNYTQSRSWQSGKKSAGWSETVDLPGDAHNLRLRAWAMTGLLWDPWGEIFNIALDGPDNKCYRAKGTTLGRSWDNNC